MVQKDQENGSESSHTLSLVDRNDKSEPRQRKGRDGEFNEHTNNEETKAIFSVDSRNYVDRRQNADRRNAIRFEDDRRKYIRRTEDRAWRVC